MECRTVLWFFVLTGLFIQTLSQEECQRGGCFPATGDLLVGRERNITASSTCGLKSRDKYCIVSFLEKTDKCFYCQSTREVDSTLQRYKYSHLPKYMVTSSPQDRLKGWWQSENGKQEVTISVDLESEFVFTHLIMTFKTFRPKSMYIERSWNYGKDWSVYRYFAYNCANSFPKIPRGPQKNIDDVICEERYSKVEPSTEGEVVMKVLDPVIQQKEDPYSVKVQNLLKLTNLRIRLTELHTFGDDVLGDNPEVNQKYYYALYEMVVRGSCSCYGHAEQCIPTEGTPANVNMVHGRCDCTHFTTGLNCERCMEGYNDEPWRPAYKNQLNVCKKCNCNGHTNKCHFDPAVYNATGRTSGGVCDDCQDNTAGRQCEQCKALYYRDPFKNIFDPDVCKPCNCDPSGSFGGGECETVTSNDADSSGTVAGRCICKQNAIGRRCDKCKDGYWNLLESNPDGCQSCNCDDRGTVGSDKCDQQTGRCRCKRYVKGLTCSKCSDGYWALGTTPEGCKPCECDPGGAKNSTCDDVSGMCQCRQYLTGRKCDKVRPGYYFANLDGLKYEAEEADGSSASTSISRRIYGGKDEVEFTGDGYLQVQQGSIVKLDNIEVPYSGRYNIVFRYDNDEFGDWDDVRITISKKNGAKLGENECAPFEALEQTLYTTLPRDKLAEVVGQSICLEKGVEYNMKIDFKSNNGRGNVQTFIDSILLLPETSDLDLFKGREGSQRKDLYDQYNCKQYYLKPGNADKAPQVCKDLQFSISSEMNGGGLPCRCDPTGTQSSGNSEILTCADAGGQCPCKPGVVGRRCDRCAPAYFGFGPSGCKACDCSNVGSVSLFCHDSTGKCPCKPQLEGRKCDSCPINYYGFPSCKPCQCSGHSETCDAVTGRCINCRHNTDGYNCHKCAEGYYGDATKGTDGDCQRCQCPGGSSTNQFSNTCRLQGDGKVICDNCIEGYTGNQCEKCTDGYYGDPVKAGGYCQKCNCNGNIDSFADGKCDSDTGVCNNCINNADGDQCERCKSGYFGNAKNQTCRECVCNILGTNPKLGVCDHAFGQCPCFSNVEGIQCDKCAPGFYNLVSGTGCEPCDCDKDGSLEGSCNQMDGQCRCRVGFGGRNCSECEDFSWGNPKEENGCQVCGCNPVGSKTLQCDRSTGVCLCKDNVIGEKCDMCAPRTSGIMPKCEDCHTCNDQWEDIVNLLEKKINNVMKLKGNFTFNSTEIGLYAREVKALKDLLNMIENMLGNRSVDADEVDKLRKELDSFRTEFMKLDTEAKKYVTMVANTISRDENANDELDNLDLRFKKLKLDFESFKGNLTEIIESDVGGALNSTRDSLQNSRDAQKSVDKSSEKLKESKKLRKRIKKEVIKGEPSFEDLDNENNKLIGNLTSQVNDLEGKLEKLNRMLCGGVSENCGGCTASGCESCGTASGNCTGVKQQANEALAKAVDAKRKLMEKKAQAEIMLADVKRAEQAVNDSRLAADKAEQSSNAAKKVGEEALSNITTLIKDINEFLNEKFKHPNISKALAMETLNLSIPLTPEEVKKLADEINKTVNELENVETILNESRKDYLTAIHLKKEALQARDYALAVMNKTDTILGMLTTAAKLQNNTAEIISVSRADIAKAEEVLDELKRKLDSFEDDLERASKDTGVLEGKRDKVKDKFNKNRESLNEAEKEAKIASEQAKKVNETSGELNDRYDEAKNILNGKLNMTGNVRERIDNLSREAIDLFGDALNKLEILEDLKMKYSRNEIRVQDLYDKLKKLEILAKFKRDKIEKLSKCHVYCSFFVNVICIEKLEALDVDEKQTLKEYQASIDLRKSKSE